MKDKYDAFISEYRIDRNGAQAAIRAGYSARSARQTARDLLTVPYIRDGIAALDREDFKKNRRSVDATLEEIDVISHSDIRLLFNEDGSLKHPLEWPDDIARAVASIEVFEEFERDEDGNKKLIGLTKKLKLWSKVDGLTLKAKHQKLLTEVHEHTHTHELGDRLSRARQRARAAAIDHEPSE